MASNPLLPWEKVADEAVRFCKIAAAPVRLVWQAMPMLPKVRCHVLFHPETGEAHVGLDKDATDDHADHWEAALLDLGFPKVAVAPMDIAPRAYGVEPWIWLKQASDPIISTAAKLLNYQPHIGNAIIGGPSPLAAALTSGLVGGGVGYGLGALGEQFLPASDFNSGNLRRTGAVAGALAASAPALLWGAASHTAHPDTPGLRAWLSSWPFRPQDQSLAVKAKTGLQEVLKREGEPDRLIKRSWFQDDNEPAGTGLDAFAAMPAIHRDSFGQVVWGDPNTPAPIRAATAGLVNMASYANGNTPWVSPWDIASVTATGAARGLLVGKTLGVLAGLKPESQQTLQRIGLWGGMLQAVIPNAFHNASQIFSS